MVDIAIQIVRFNRRPALVLLGEAFCGSAGCDAPAGFFRDPPLAADLRRLRTGLSPSALRSRARDRSILYMEHDTAYERRFFK
jgi:hypothetical protein